MSTFNRKQRRIIDQIPEHEIKRMDEMGEDLDRLLEELREMKSIDLPVDEMLESAQRISRQRRGILELRKQKG